MVDILRYIHENIRKPLVMAEVAKQFGFSKWHFCNRFREYTGRTFVDYVRHYRIQLAALDILKGERVTDVAMNYGYETISGFNKSFLSVYGCVPSEYRIHARESQLYYERRKNEMIALSNRCAVLREDSVVHKLGHRDFCVQRQVYHALGMAQALAEGKTNAEIVAAGVVRTVQSMRPYIGPHELLVGFNYGDGIYGGGCMPEDQEGAMALMACNGISAADGSRYLEIRRVNKPLLRRVPEYSLTQEEEQAQWEMAAIGRMIDSDHSVLGYEQVLHLGFEGLREKVTQYRDKNGDSGLYRAMLDLCDAGCRIGLSYAEEALQLQKKDDPGYDPQEMQTIAQVCTQVPAKPARNFREAVQSLLFAHILNTWEDGINANSLGRLDQILWPYYKADLENGALTREEAFELICCLWLKLYRDYDVQQSCVGGTDVNGNSQVNDLSYLMLDAVEQLGIIRCISVRFSEKTEPEFLRRALEVVGHVQKGIPFFFNDDVLIPALQYKGIAPEDACDYTQIGCVETVIPGKSNPHAVTGQTNLLKAVEYVLGNGNSLTFPQMDPGIKTGQLSDLKTYEQFYQAVLVQIEHILDISCRVVNGCRAPSANNTPRPYKSLLTQGCMESGRDFNDAGARYDYYQIMLGGIPNLADSLAVIRKYVYKEHRLTLQELKTMLEQDFPDKAMRQELVNKVPKFGNDIAEVDTIAAEIMDYACDVLEKLSEKYGISFHAQPFTFKWMIDQGLVCAASPDGRRKGEPIAYSCSPMQGRDFNGLTALLNSLSRFPTKKAPGTTSAIVEVDPKLFSDHNIDMLTQIMAAAGRAGVCNVQFNVVDADMLIDAQIHPERYSNLAVRVCGFSQNFNLLTPELQNHIIGRTKHTCL